MRSPSTSCVVYLYSTYELHAQAHTTAKKQRTQKILFFSSDKLHKKQYEMSIPVANMTLNGIRFAILLHEL